MDDITRILDEVQNQQDAEFLVEELGIPAEVAYQLVG